MKILMMLVAHNIECELNRKKLISNGTLEIQLF